MAKTRLTRAEPNNCTLRDWDETPPEAIFYHGFWLLPDEIERLREIEIFHRKFGNKPFQKHKLQEETHEKTTESRGSSGTAQLLGTDD